MKDITLANISQVIRTEIHAAVHKEVHVVVRKELADFEVRFWLRLNADLDERFNEILNAIGEEHEKLVTAIGGHTIELTDHERRIKRLEKLTT